MSGSSLYAKNLKYKKTQYILVERGDFMLKIGDFSKLTHISVRMLRYYDKQNLLKPSYVDPVTGYRMYAVEQVAELQKIVMLRDLNFGVAEITNVLDNWSDKQLIKRLCDKIREAESIIKAEKKRIVNIQKTIEHVRTKTLDKHYNVTIKAIAPITVISLRRKIASYFDENLLWQELMDFVQSEHIEYDRSKRNNVVIYHDEEHMDTDVDIEVCLIVRKMGQSRNGFIFRELEPLDYAACMMVYGPYDNLADAYSFFVNWLGKNKTYCLGETARQITIVDCNDTNNPNEYLTEIQLPLIMN